MSLPLFQGGRRDSEGWSNAMMGSFLEQKNPDSHHVEEAGGAQARLSVSFAEADRPNGRLSGLLPTQGV